MCAAVESKSNKKKMKHTSMLGYCNEFFSKIVPSSSKSMLKTDAVAINNTLPQLQLPSNDSNWSNGNSPQQSLIPSTNSQIVPTLPMQLVQNNLNQANQNLTVIESQQNLHFSNVQGLQIGNTIHVSGSNSRKNSCNESYEDRGTYKKTRSLIELLNCNDPVEMRTMRISSKSIGGNWRMVFRDLELPEAEIAQIKEQYFHISVEEVIYQLLLRWKRNSDDPSLGKLSTVLWENNNYECLTELKRYFKKYKKSQINPAEDSHRKSTCDTEGE